ncbi:WbqC family protein [Candidatus Ponderosibacter sp. Uisw_141_02]|uniref:WbqC family protein n=1 Tax=Candidatus Ponderosibacter sp. Uisw_141_02 TaxID=3231000 RepID=UPI003D5416C3
MQPYFLPYLGYYHLINAVDVFVIYDDIQYTKKGWINRNRLIFNEKVDYFTISLVKDSDFLNVNQRKISQGWEKDKSKLLRKLEQSYRKRKNFERGFSLTEKILNYDDDNLFNYINHSVKLICQCLGVKTEIVTSSSLGDFSEYKGKDKVIAICNRLNGERYINVIGGMSLYDKEEFQNSGLDLKFVKSKLQPYDQNSDIFVPGLSIIDMIFSIAEEASMLEQMESYELI